MLGVLPGIALGVALSLLMLIFRTSHPKGAVLGQLPGTEAYRDVHRHPEALTFPGLLIWRAGGDLILCEYRSPRRGAKGCVGGEPPAGNACASSVVDLTKDSQGWQCRAIVLG
jgi:hypothetical protein